MPLMAELPDIAGAYLLFAAVPACRRLDHDAGAADRQPVRTRLTVFGPLLDGVFPIYIGSSTSSVRTRALRHVTMLERCGALRPSDFWVSTVPADSRGAAMYIEATLQDMLEPVLCAPPLRGFGSRVPGQLRDQRRVSGWDALVPAGRWARRPTLIEHARAVLEVAVRVTEPGALQPRWSPLEPVEDR